MTAIDCNKTLYERRVQTEREGKLPKDVLGPPLTPVFLGDPGWLMLGIPRKKIVKEETNTKHFQTDRKKRTVLNLTHFTHGLKQSVMIYSYLLASNHPAYIDQDLSSYKKGYQDLKRQKAPLKTPKSSA